MNRLSSIIATTILTCVAAPSLAQSFSTEGEPEFSLSAGYANVNLKHSSVIDNEGALRFEPNFNFSPIQPLPQFRLGFDVGITMVLDNSSRTIVSNNGNFIFIGSSDIPLWLIEPEVRLSWRQYLGDQHQFFIEPGAAAGYAFGFLQLDAEESSSKTFDSDANAFYTRAFLRAGLEVEGGLAGVEASYLWGEKMDFGGNASGDLNEFYIGVFGALVF